MNSITLWSDELLILKEYWTQGFFNIQNLKDKWYKKVNKKISNLKLKWFIRNIKKWLYYIIPLENIQNNYYIPDWKFFIQFIEWNPIISYWTALSYHDLSEQLFNKLIITVNNNIKQHHIKLAWIDFYLVKKLSNNDFWIQNIIVSNNYVKITDIERTILDCLDRPNLCMNIKEWIKAYYTAYHEWQLNFNKINNYLNYYNSKSKLIKILWYFSDLFWIKVPKTIYNQRQKELKQNYVYLEKDTKKIKWQIYDKKWKIIINNNENFKSLITY